MNLQKKKKNDGKIFKLKT